VIHWARTVVAQVEQVFIWLTITLDKMKFESAAEALKSDWDRVFMFSFAAERDGAGCQVEVSEGKRGELGFPQAEPG
jgi:hypothetical protein